MKFNAAEFLSSLQSLESKDLFFSGSEYSWADDSEIDETYGELVCSYDDFVDAVTDYINGNARTISKLIKINGADIDDINKMIANDGVIELEQIDE